MEDIRNDRGMTPANADTIFLIAAPLVVLALLFHLWRKTMKKDALDRIADALEWRNYWDWHNSKPEVTAFDGVDPPPPPPPPVPRIDPRGG